MGEMALFNIVATRQIRRVRVCVCVAPPFFCYVCEAWAQSFTTALVWCVMSYLAFQLLYFQSLLRQDIGWFDMNSAGDLATRLAE